MRFVSDTGSSKNQSNQPTSNRLVESLCILESYHILILQRPAHLSANVIQLTSPRFSPAIQSPTSVDILEDRRQMFSSLMNPQMALYSPTTSSASTICLAILAAVSGNVTSEGKSLITVSWKQDLLELGLHRWFSSYRSRLQNENHLSITSLFHLIFISIRTNLELVHKFAKWQVGHRKENDTRMYLSELQAWQSSEDCEVATYHAKELADMVKQSVVFNFASNPGSGTNTPSMRSTQSRAGQKRVAEAPHLATGVYMATLVLWTAAVARQKPDWAVGSMVLENGILTLSCFQVRMAAKLGRVLKCLIHGQPRN